MTSPPTAPETQSEVDSALFPPVDRVARIFNGCYTITSPTGNHRTFKISTMSPDSSFAPNQRIIALLNGTDNEDNYMGFGFVTDNGISVWSSRKIKGSSTKSQYEKFAAMVWSMAINGEKSFFYQHGCRLLLEGRCIRCNRKLTHPTSILSGIGPECAKRE